MRTIETKLYQFEELNEQAKQKAVEQCYYYNVDYDWWDSVYYDAKEMGLKITGFDIDRGSYCDIEFIYCADETVEKIIKNCGENTDLYKIAKEYKKDFDELVKKYSDGINTEIVAEGNEYEFDREVADLTDEFLNQLEEEYLVILRDEYEYLTSKEAIIETIISNEFEFTEDGERY